MRREAARQKIYSLCLTALLLFCLFLAAPAYAQGGAGEELDPCPISSTSGTPAGSDQYWCPPCSTMGPCTPGETPSVDPVSGTFRVCTNDGTGAFQWVTLNAGTSSGSCFPGASPGELRDPCSSLGGSCMQFCDYRWGQRNSPPDFDPRWHNIDFDSCLPPSVPPAGVTPGVHSFDVASHVTALEDAWPNLWWPAYPHMAEQFVTSMMHQVFMIGTFFDAREQIRTKRLFRKKTVEAHQDYHPSHELCRIGTNVRTLFATEFVAETNATLLDKALMDRELLMYGTSSAPGQAVEIQSRIERFRKIYCDPSDSAGSVAAICNNIDPATGTIAFPERINRDIDYTRMIETEYTLDIDFTDSFLTADEEDVMALLTNLFSYKTFPYVNPAYLTREYAKDEMQDMRSVTAIRSVARDSMTKLVGMRAQSTAGATTAPYMHNIMISLGVPATEAAEFLGANPSYYAQMEVLTRRLYQSPEFYTNLYTKPTDVARVGASLQAIELMQQRDRYEAALRREMLVSMILEMKLREEQDAISNKILQDVSSFKNLVTPTPPPPPPTPTCTPFPYADAPPGPSAIGSTVTVYTTGSSACGTSCPAPVTRTCLAGGVWSPPASALYRNCTDTIPGVCTISLLDESGTTLPATTVPHTGTITAWQTPTGSPSCISEDRICDGCTDTMSGSYLYESCCSTAGATCTLPWGGTISEGDVVTAYLDPSACGIVGCASRSRTCQSDGTLSGDPAYQYPTCIRECADCTTLDGETVPHAETVRLYVGPPNPCAQAASQSMCTCQNGGWTGCFGPGGTTAGAYVCVDEDADYCEPGGYAWSPSCASVAYAAPRGTSITIRNTVPGYRGTASVSCGIGGSWTLGSTSCNPVTCTDPWGGTMNEGDTITAYRAASAAGCEVQTRQCQSNGSLSGSSIFRFASCTSTYTSACAPPGCPDDTVTWSDTISGTTYTCSGNLSASTDGSSATATAGWPLVGSADFSCNSGSWNLTTMTECRPYRQCILGATPVVTSRGPYNHGETVNNIAGPNCAACSSLVAPISCTCDDGEWTSPDTGNGWCYDRNDGGCPLLDCE